MIPVMIVDDEFIVRVGMRSMVDWNKYGYEVVAEASNGQEGLAQFRKYRPRLIFCDINMPDMSGLEMLEEIRKIDQDVACVILTAYQEFSYAQQAIRLGTPVYVIKATMLTEDIVYESAQGDAAAAKEEVNRRVQQINRSLLALDLPTAKQETESLFSEVVTPTGSLEIQHIAVVGLLGALAQYLPLDEKRELTRLKKLTRRSDLLAWFFAHIDQIGVAREGVTPSRLHVENAKAYIRSHYHEPISLKNVAAELAISQNYLSKIFYKETGRHITDFIADEKITRACELLRTTAEPVSAIAEELGFVDQAYFTKRFKMKMGISPNGYRKKHTAP